MKPKRAPDSFQGFPREAFDFFVSLAANNNREWFHEHRKVYERACREPMKLLLNELAPESDVMLSRISRDARFAQGRPPYRTYIAGGFDGNYLSLSERGVFVGAGLYRPAGNLLDRFRRGVDDSKTGERLTKILDALREKDFVVDTHERLKRVPPGYPADHPRAELLRMKGLFGGKTFPPAPWLSTRESIEAYRDAVVDLGPLAEWIRAHTREPNRA
jgi:uncharacterized protein (TIGR02453 family)